MSHLKEEAMNMACWHLFVMHANVIMIFVSTFPKNIVYSWYNKFVQLLRRKAVVTFCSNKLINVISYNYVKTEQQTYKGNWWMESDALLVVAIVLLNQ